MALNFTTGIDDATHKNGPPETRAHLVLGVNYALLAVAVLVVSSRILVKAKLRKLVMEDSLIVASTFASAVLVVLTHLAAGYGFGMHAIDIHPDWWLGYSKYSYASIVIACTPYPMTKVSMLCFYLRLAPQPTFRKVCLSIIIYILTSSITITLLNLFSCTPVRGGWDHSPELGAKCIDATLFYYFYCSMNVVTDVLLMVLPIPILLRLQLRRKVKYGLVAMFATGTLITAISTFSVYSMYGTYHSEDVTWDGAYSWMWAMIEINIAIVVACMPSMVLFTKWVRGDMTEAKSTGTGSARSRGLNATIGSGGGGGGSSNARKYSHNKVPTDLNTRGNGSEEYIMQDLTGMVKSTEMMVVEMGMPPGSRGGDGSSMC